MKIEGIQEGTRRLIIFGQNLDFLAIVLPEEETKGGKRKRKEKEWLSLLPPAVLLTTLHSTQWSFHTIFLSGDTWIWI